MQQGMQSKTMRLFCWNFCKINNQKGFEHTLSRPEIGLHIKVNKWTKKQQLKSSRTVPLMG